MFARAVLGEMGEAIEAFLDRRYVAAWHPPQRVVRTGQRLEPRLALTRAAFGERVDRVELIDKARQSRVVERRDRATDIDLCELAAGIHRCTLMSVEKAAHDTSTIRSGVDNRLGEADA